MEPKQHAPRAHATRSLFEVHRWVFIALGLLAFALGGIGVFVPGLPTTVFLLIGSFLLARSCPGLRARLLAHRVFRPYARFVEPGGVITRRDRITGLTGMWSAISVSVVVLALTVHPAWWVTALIVATGLLGTWFIVRVWGR